MNCVIRPQFLFRRLRRRDRDLLWLLSHPSGWDRRTTEELFAVWQRSTRALDAAFRKRHRLPRASVARAAVDTLATGHTLAERLLAHRWETAAHALHHGTELRTVARAMRLAPDAFKARYTEWVDDLVARARLNRRTRGKLLALLR